MRCTQDPFLGISWQGSGNSTVINRGKSEESSREGFVLQIEEAALCAEHRAMSLQETEGELFKW